MIKQVTIIPEIKVEHHVSYFLDDTSKSMGTYLLYLNGNLHCTYTSLKDVEKAIVLYIKDELLKKVIT